MHDTPGKDKGMVWFNCLFASGLLLHPSAKHWTKIIRIPSKKTELTTAIGSWFTAPPRFDLFLPEELFEWPWVDAHSEQFSASKVIPLRKADWLQAFWFQFFLTATAAKNPMKTQRFRCRMAWWALRCLVNTLRVRLTHTFSSAQLWCAIRHGEDVGADFGGNPTFITITRQRFQPCSQIGPFPQVGVKIENTWNHHLAKVLLHTFFSRTTPLTKILRNLQNTLHPKQIPLQSLKQRKENQG